MTALVENTAFLERLLSDRSPQMHSSDRLPSSPSELHLQRILQGAGLDSYGTAPASPPPASSSSGQQTPPDGYKGSYPVHQGSPFGMRFGDGSSDQQAMAHLEQRMAGLDMDAVRDEEEMIVRMQRDEMMRRDEQMVSRDGYDFPAVGPCLDVAGTSSRKFMTEDRNIFQIYSTHTGNNALRNLPSHEAFAILQSDAFSTAQLGLDMRQLSALSQSRSSYPPAFADSESQGGMTSHNGQGQTFSRRSAFFHRDLPNVTPPDGYVCKLCFVPGHFMKHCALYRERPRFEPREQAFRKGGPYTADVPPENYLCKLCFIPGHFMKNCSLYKERTPAPFSSNGQALNNNTNGYHKDGAISVNGGGSPPPGLYSPAIQRAAHLRAVGMQMHSNPVRKSFTTVPPDGYVCKICTVPGHWIQQCPIRNMQSAPTQQQNIMGGAYGYGTNGFQQQYDGQWDRGY
ncbi:hypothetical protein HDU93_004605 [Gonapodya sp. JEL0774]|nr:hypothetical protein HDU93_004605 [Gonapodya sp. JEL0774]